MTMTRQRHCLLTPKSTSSRKVSQFRDSSVWRCNVVVCLFVCLLLCYLYVVLEEVEKQLTKFREDLRKKLLKLPSTLEEQKRLIKYVQY